MASIFLVNCMSQAPHLGRLLSRSKFEWQQKNHVVKSCGKNCINCPYLVKASLYQFKQVNNFFLLKTSCNCESSNLIYVVICQGCQEYIGETSCLVKEQINIYRRQIRPLQYKKLAVEEHLRAFRSVHWGINPPAKTPLPSFSSTPLYSSLPFLLTPLPIYWFFATPP